MTTPSDFLPGPGRFQSFMVIDSWRADDAGPATDEPFVTQPFTFDRSPWAVVWWAGEAGMSLTLREIDSPDSMHSDEVLVEVAHEGQGVSYVHREGTFCLIVEGKGRWVAKVVDVN